MNGSHDINDAQSFTRSAVLLTMGFNGTVLATGSGVIARESSGDRYLTTALHNLSGRRPGENTPISTHGGVPNQLRVEGCGFDYRANLYAGENNPNVDEPLFAVHERGSSIDVTVLRLPNSTRFDHPLDSSFLTPRMNLELRLRAGQTCYILGFPEGLIHRPVENVAFPIWKTGNIASEPMFDFDGEPKLLIDATTRRGMSGGMVVVSENDRNRLVGIYSGRYKQAAVGDPLEDDPRFTTELGWVYRAEVITDLIRAFRH